MRMIPAITSTMLNRSNLQIGSLIKILAEITVKIGAVAGRGSEKIKMSENLVTTMCWSY